MTRRPCACTRPTWVPGVAGRGRKRHETHRVGCRTGSSPTSCSPTCWSRVSPTSSSSPSRSTPWTRAGDTSPSGSSPRPPGTGLRTIFATSSIVRTSSASVSFSTGCRGIFRATIMAWRFSTERRSTSTPILARRSTRTGARSSSTTASRPCVPFWYRARDPLARGLPRRRAPRRRGGIDAVPGLLAPGGGVGAQSRGRQREPRGGVDAQVPERRGPRRMPGSIDDRRRVDGLAEGVPRYRPRRTRLRPEVEPGMDERRPRSNEPPPRASLRPLPPAPFLPRVRLQRTLRAAPFLTTRSRTARARFSRRCRARSKRGSPTCASSWHTSGPIRARRSSSWGRSSDRNGSGTRAGPSTGRSSTTPSVGRSRRSCAS